MGTGVYYFTPQTSRQNNRRFEAVTSDDQIYCYDSLASKSGQSIPNTIFLIQLTTPDTLKIERQSLAECGTGPWSFSSAIIFER